MAADTDPSEHTITGRSTWEILEALARNVELVKVMVAQGVLLVGKLVVLQLVLPKLQADIWGHGMARVGAEVSLALAWTAIVTSSHFGLFSDKYGRRAAAAVLGVCSFLPSWGVLVFGLNERGLYASMVGSVISGVGVNSNVLVVLASDVTRKADREAAFGAFQAVSLLMQLLLLGVPSVLILCFKVFSTSPRVVLIYQVLLSIVYFLLLASVRVPPRPRSPEESPPSKVQSRGCARACREACLSVFQPLRLCGVRSLRNLAATFFLVAFSGDLLMDVGSQFFRQTLGILDSGTRHQHQLVSVVSMLPSQFLVLPGYIAVGLFSKRLGSQRVLLTLIPVSAVLLAAGATLLWVPQVWYVGVVTVAQSYGQLVNVPLQHLATVLAPPNREGEVMGMMGAFQQAANMLGNLAVVIATPLLQKKSGMGDPLWIYYPAGGIIVLLAVIPASGLVLSSTKQEISSGVEDEDTETGMDSEGITTSEESNANSNTDSSGRLQR